MTEKTPRGAREPQSLEAWESWVDKLIVEAQERGDFDNLPGHGKPLQIEDSPFADGREIGFGMLKNAGVAPFWIELEKEIRAKTERMDELIARMATLANTRPQLSPEGPPPPKPRRRWWPFGRNNRIRVEIEPLIFRNVLDIGRIRDEYLRLAEERNQVIAQYNAAIPRELWQLERPQQTVEEAASSFELAMDLAAKGKWPHSM